MQEMGDATVRHLSIHTALSRCPVSTTKTSYTGKHARRQTRLMSQPASPASQPASLNCRRSGGPPVFAPSWPLASHSGLWVGRTGRVTVGQAPDGRAVGSISNNRRVGENVLLFLGNNETQVYVCLCLCSSRVVSCWERATFRVGGPEEGGCHNFYRRLGGSTTRQPPIGAKPPAREGGRSIHVGTVTRAGILFHGRSTLYVQQHPSLRLPVCFVMDAQRLVRPGCEGAQSFHR